MSGALFRVHLHNNGDGGLPLVLQVDTLGQACWVLRRQSYDIMTKLRDFSAAKAQDYRFMLCILPKSPPLPTTKSP